MAAVPFAIITVNYGSSELVATNFAALELPPEGRLIIVDSFSTTAEQERIRQVAESLRAECVLLDANLGYGGGTNAGAKRAIELGAEVILPLNPDAQIDGESLRMLVTAAAASASLISPKILTGSGKTWFAGADLYLDDGTTAGVAARNRHTGRPRKEWATGACFAISTELWLRTGGFDEDYFLYWEDIDFSHRVLALGGALVQSDAVVIHDEGGTHADEHPSQAKSATYYYFNIRNRLLYARKHLDQASAARWVRSAPRVAYSVLLQGGRRQLVTSIAPWRAYFRGLRDGRKMFKESRVTFVGAK